MPQKSIYDLYEYLPKTNCGQCGMTCMKFASYLLARDVRPDDCPPLSDPEFEEKKGQLIEILGEFSSPVSCRSCKCFPVLKNGILQSIFKQHPRYPLALGI